MINLRYIIVDKHKLYNNTDLFLKIIINILSILDKYDQKLAYQIEALEIRITIIMLPYLSLHLTQDVNIIKFSFSIIILEN